MSRIDRSIIDNIKITDNILFTSVFENRVILKMFLEIVLKFKIVEVDFIQKEKEIVGIGKSRGVRLDIYVKDIDGNIYNVEIQTSDEHNLPKRLRYYQSRIDIDNLEKGDDFNNLKTTYIIFICMFNPFKKIELDDYIYKIEPHIIYNNGIIALNDGTHKIIINTKYNVSKINDDNMKSFIELIEDGFNPRTKSELTSMIVREVNRLKRDEKWGANYVEVMEAYALKKIEKIVVKMIQNGADDNFILKCTDDLTPEQLEQIKKDLNK